MATTISRPDKLTDAETVLYEIRMLRFAASRLHRGKWESEEDSWLCLEAFLIHYRNLIEFLGRPKDGRQNDLLHVSSIWDRIGTQPPQQIANLQAEGEKLFVKYERAEDCISRYLQHCTIHRTQPKRWEVGQMIAEMEPLLAAIDEGLRPGHPQPNLTLAASQFSMSTCSVQVVGPLIGDWSTPTKIK
jgi:hypothetical protein